jgi:hypothetical protein
MYSSSLQAEGAGLAQCYGQKQIQWQPRLSQGVLTELWEEYGIHGENPPVRETSSIKNFAIMHDDGVNAFGLSVIRTLEWMIANGFPVRDVNLTLY